MEIIWLLIPLSIVLVGVMRYTRDFEREADAYAIRFMQANLRPVAALDTLLERIEAKRGDRAAVPAFLSTHPLTDERRQQMFVDEALDDMRHVVGDQEAEQYGRAGRLDYSWQGLARYWRKQP